MKLTYLCNIPHLRWWMCFASCFICSVLTSDWFLWNAFTLYHCSAFWPESPSHHCGPADLWWSFHVYIWVNPVQSGGLCHGAVGILSRGNPLDPHTGPHAESRAWSVQKWQILVSVQRIHIISNFIFVSSFRSSKPGRCLVSHSATHVHWSLPPFPV